MLWQSLMRLLDIHPPRFLNVNRRLSHFVISQQFFTHSSLGAPLRVEKTHATTKRATQQDLQLTPLGETQHCTHNKSHPQAHSGELQCVLRDKEAQHPTVWQEVSLETEVGGTTFTKEESIEAMWKRFGKTALMRAAIEHKNSGVQFMFEA